MLVWEKLSDKSKDEVRELMKRLGCSNWQPLLPSEEESVLVLEARRKEIKKLMTEKPRGMILGRKD